MSEGARLGFHESTVLRFEREGDNAILMLDGVRSNGRTCAATLRLEGLRDVQSDGQPVRDFGMVYGDGEVLTLETRPDGLSLIVEWNDFPSRRSVTRSYVLTGRRLEITPAPFG